MNHRQHKRAMHESPSTGVRDSTYNVQICTGPACPGGGQGYIITKSAVPPAARPLTRHLQSRRLYGEKSLHCGASCCCPLVGPRHKSLTTTFPDRFFFFAQEMPCYDHTHEFCSRHATGQKERRQQMVEYMAIARSISMQLSMKNCACRPASRVATADCNRR